MIKRPLRVLGYGRVSQVNGRGGPSFIAPETYRESIEHFVSQRGHDLAETVIELDESGGTLDRPEFQRLLGLLNDGEADGLCVPNLARFSRSTIEGLTLARELKKAGKALLIADLDMDTTTPTGKMMLTVLLAVGEMELDMSRERWAIAQRKAMERGVYPGTTPTGYTRDEDGRMVIDPVAGPAIRRVFEGRAAGLSWAGLARRLDNELPRDGGQPWLASTVKAMLDSPIYLGRLERTVGGRPIVIEGAHTPLVERALFEAVQVPAGRAPQHRSIPAVLAGIVRCASCGGAMTRGSEKKKTVRYDYYRCSRVCERFVRVSARALDRHVLGLVYERLANTPHVDASLRNGSAVKEMEAALSEAELELMTFVTATKAVLGAEAMAEGSRVRQQAVDEARRNLAQAVAREQAAGPAHADLIEQLRDGDDGKRNRILRTMLESVTVKKADGPGRQGDLSRRVSVVWVDDDPAQDPAELSDKPVRKRATVTAKP